MEHAANGEKKGSEMKEGGFLSWNNGCVLQCVYLKIKGNQVAVDKRKRSDLEGRAIFVRISGKSPKAKQSEDIATGVTWNKLSKHK